MEKVIEFYVPKRFRKAFVRADQANRERSSNFVRGQRRQHRFHLLAGSLRCSCQGQCPTLLQVASTLRDPRLLREDPVMSAITMFIEGEPTVCRGVIGAHIQELDCVVSRYLPMFYKRALRFLGNAPDAEDAVQDALLSAYRHLGQFRGQAQLSTWLMTIVTNAARMKLRRRHSGYFSLDQEQGEEGLTFSERLADSKPSPEEVCSTVEARNRLVEGVERLSPKLRRAFQLRDIDGLTTKETAHVLGVPQGTVKAQLARARAQLAGIMRGKPVRQQSRTVSVGKRSPRTEPRRRIRFGSPVSDEVRKSSPTEETTDAAHNAANN
jgi:RNA polymerase sigma-70 factor, ECF subfamily